MDFRGTSCTGKIVIEVLLALEQVSNFDYLGHSVSYNTSSDVA